MKKYELRQNQLMTTFGVGSIFDMDCQSFMPMSADLWDWNPAEPGVGVEIKDDALVARLKERGGFTNLQKLYQLPVKMDAKDNDMVTAIRFPQWLYCPLCGRLKPYDEWRRLWNKKSAQDNQGKKGKKEAQEKKTDPFLSHPRCTFHTMALSRLPKLLPVRFVVACRAGHINDFPWIEWTHRGREICNTPDLKISLGASAGLSGITVKCSCGCEHSMADAFSENVWKDLNIRCKGAMPWRGFDQGRSASSEDKWEHEPCGCTLHTLQKGGSNIHYPMVLSTITIPPVSDGLYNAVRNFGSTRCIETMYAQMRQSGVQAIEGDLAPAQPAEAPSVETVINQFNQVLRQECNNQRISYDTAVGIIKKICEPHQEGNQSDDKILYAEFSAMKGNERHFENHPDDQLRVVRQDLCHEDTGIMGWLADLCCVTRLREISVLYAFTRILSFQDGMNQQDGERLKPQRIVDSDSEWLPASEGFGEGIFLSFRPEKLQEWAAKQEIRDYMSTLSDANRPKVEEILLHTLSHCLMKELSFFAGYSLTALKEHIYCASPGCQNAAINAMYGILIYTTAPDKYGTMGGLVKLGAPAILKPLLENAIKNCQFCSNDPLCRDNSSGAHSFASCFACTFLPETSCCMFNQWLDRRLLINFPGNHNRCKWEGFFNPLL